MLFLRRKSLKFLPIRKLNWPSMLNFKMKQKSYTLRANQETFLPCLVPIGPMLCEKGLKCLKLNDTDEDESDDNTLTHELF